jgi:hypothetical protein
VQPDAPRVVFEDPDLPHQIVITMRKGFNIMVSCNCLKVNDLGSRGTYEPIEVRTRWEAAEAIAVWRAHVEPDGPRSG